MNCRSDSLRLFLKELDGAQHEPIEHLVVEVPDEYSGKVIEMVTQRKGELTIMEPKGDLQHLEFDVPARGLIGLRNNMPYCHRGPGNYESPFQRLPTL